MTDKYPRVTQIQVELWLVDPVTQAVLLGFSELTKKIDEKMNVGGFIDPANNDLSMNEYHQALGVKQGLRSAGDFVDVLKMCEFIGEPK